MKFQFWDTSGQEVYKSIAPGYYRGALGAIFVVDLTTSEHLERIVGWLKTCFETTGTEICKVLLGNKTDLPESREITTEQLKSIADQYKMPFFEVSAKSGEKVEDGFMTLLKEIKTKHYAEVKRPEPMSLKKPENKEESDGSSCPC